MSKDAKDGASLRGPDSGFKSNASTPTIQFDSSLTASLSVAVDAAPNTNQTSNGTSQAEHGAGDGEDNLSLSLTIDELEEDGDAAVQSPPGDAAMPTVSNEGGAALRNAEPGASNQDSIDVLSQTFPANREYRDRSRRMQSFSQPASSDLDREIIADAGFFELPGNPLLMRCFSCNGLVKRTELRSPTDPWTVHAKISPKCAHLISTKGSAFAELIQAKLTAEDAAFFSELDSDRGVRRQEELIELIENTFPRRQQSGPDSEQRLSSLEQTANSRDQRLTSVEHDVSDDRERTSSLIAETSRGIANVEATANQNKDAISVMGNTVDAERDARIRTDGRVDTINDQQQLTNVTTRELAKEIAINSNELETQKQENRVNRRTDRMALRQEERTRESDIEGLRASIPGAVEEHFQEVVAENLQENINNIERGVQSVASDVRRVEENLQRVGDQSHTTAVGLRHVIEDRRDPDIRRADAADDGGDEPVVAADDEPIQ